MQFALLFSAITVASLGIGLVIPIIPVLVKDAGAGQNLFVGLSATIMALSFSLSSIPLGKWIDKTNSKNSILLGLVIYGLSMAFFPLFNDVLPFFIIRTIEGIGWAGIWIGTETTINQMSSEKNRGQNMGIYGFCISLGMACGPVMGTYLLEYGIFYPFLICSFLSLFCFVFILLFLQKNVPRLESSKKTSISLWMIRDALFAALIYGIFEASMMSMFPTYFLSSSFDKTSISIVITSFFIGGIFFQIPAGKISDKIGKTRCLVTNSTLLCIILIIFANIQSIHICILLAFLTGAFGGAFYPVGLSILPDKLKKEQLGVGNASFTFVYGIGSIIGPTAIAILMDIFGNKSIFYAIMSLCIFFVVFTFMTRNKNEKER
ncbi:MAG: MFS transporter [Fibrobacter sp.]|nr:MFS transporter [Fibrobacter sp.]